MFVALLSGNKALCIDNYQGLATLTCLLYVTIINTMAPLLFSILTGAIKKWSLYTARKDEKSASE